MKRCLIFTVCISPALMLSGCALYAPSGGDSEATEFSAVLTGAAERPDPVETDGMGTGTFQLNEEETELSYDIEVSGLSGDVIAAHFHLSLTGAEGFGDVVFGITDSVVNEGNGSASASGVWPLTSEALQNLRLGYIYVNFHTAQHPAGEVRGNLVAAE